MNTKAAFAIGCAVISLAVAGSYIYISQKPLTNSATKQEAKSKYIIPGGYLGAGTASDEVNWQTYQAAMDSFASKGDRKPARKFLSDLRAEVIKGNFWSAFYLNAVVKIFPRLGLTYSERDDFMRSLPILREPTLRAVQAGWENLIKLRSQPFEFSGTTMDGAEFDLKSLRGKVVLIDFWDTACPACFEGMARIDPIYKKYKASGFEVVSIVTPTWGQEEVNLEDAIRKKVELKRDKGIDFPVSINGSERWVSTTNKYILGKPSYFLLDRDGKLIAEDGHIDNARNLEEWLKKVL